MKRNKRDDDNGFAAWGGYMAAKKSKLQDQFSIASKVEEVKTSIFKGISIFVNGYTKPSAEELKQIMMMHDGIYHHYHIPNKTMYIIASNLPDTKVKQLGSNQKIVKPDWISESLKAGKLLDYTNYLLYSNQNRTQPGLNFKRLEKNVAALNKQNKIIDDNESYSSLSLIDTGKRADVKLDCDETFSYNKIIPNISRENSSKLTEKKGRTLTANDPKFLSEFYSNSRLHLISTLGTTFKQHISNLREQSNNLFPEREKLKTYASQIHKDSNDISKHLEQPNKNSVIMHIDMDCFFVSVGLRSRPELRGQPVAVTHSKNGTVPSTRSGVDRQAELDCYRQRLQENSSSTEKNNFGPGNMLSRLEGIENQSMSEIASCSYEARKVGVKNGMFMGTALQLCPNLKTIPYDFECYKEVAYTLYNTISEYTLNVEAVSCDEMFVDITDILQETTVTIYEWATYIRNLIKNRTGCPCSAGFGANKLQARMATRRAKPCGQFYLSSEDVNQHMVDIKVSDLPGVGRSMSNTLKSLGITTCGDLQSLLLSKLQSEFGSKLGETLYKHCRGIDERSLVYEYARKSVSAEVNYGIRFKSNREFEIFLKQLAEEVHIRLSEINMKGKCITLKLMVRSKDAPVESSKYMGHGICDHVTKSTTLLNAISDLGTIIREVLLISQKLAVPPQDLRGIGIQISRLEKISKTGKCDILTKFLNTTKNVSTDKKISSKTILEDNNQHNNAKKICTSPKKDIQSFIQNMHITSDVKKKNPNDQENVINKVINCDTVSNDKSRNKNVLNNHPCVLKPGKTRGRPRGRGNKTIPDRNTTKLYNFFPPQNQKQNILPDIDLEVLNALPEDIRNEVLQQYQIPERKINNKNNKGLFESPSKSVEKNKVANETAVDNLPRMKPLQNEENKKFIKTEIFSKIDLTQLKRLLRNWIKSEQIPETCDVKMLSQHFKQLAIDKNIEDLFDILQFLYSIVFSKTCDWHKAFFEILNVSQEGMISTYGKRMWFHKDFNCDKMCKKVC